MSVREWMKNGYGLGSLSGNYKTTTTEPTINTDLRRDQEDKKYKVEKSGSEDIIDLLDEVEK